MVGLEDQKLVAAVLAEEGAVSHSKLSLTGLGDALRDPLYTGKVGAVQPSTLVGKALVLRCRVSKVVN